MYILHSWKSKYSTLVLYLNSALVVQYINKCPGPSGIVCMLNISVDVGRWSLWLGLGRPNILPTLYLDILCISTSLQQQVCRVKQRYCFCCCPHPPPPPAIIYLPNISGVKSKTGPAQCGEADSWMYWRAYAPRPDLQLTVVARMDCFQQVTTKHFYLVFAGFVIHMQCYVYFVHIIINARSHCPRV